MVGRRTLIADEQAATRAGMRRVLERAGFAVCAEAADGEAVVAAAGSARPDLCLVGIALSVEAIDVIARVRALVPQCAVVVLTASSDDRRLFGAIRAGALGCLPKDMDPERLPAALDGVLRGEAAIPRALMARLLEDYRRLGSGRRVPLPGGADAELTEREWEVLQELRRGRTTSQIAELLSISPVTVRRHVSELVRKLGVTSREAAVRRLEGGGE